MKVCTELGLKTSLKFLVEDTDIAVRKGGRWLRYVVYVMMDRVTDTYGCVMEEVMRYYLRDQGGKIITPIPPKDRLKPQEKPDVLVRWVVPPKRDGQLKNRYITYGNEPGTGFEYAHFSLIVSVGKFGDRQGEGEETYNDAEFMEDFGDGDD